MCYILLLATFLATTFMCFLDHGNYFEVGSCRDSTLPTNMLHHLAEIFVIFLHVFVNLTTTLNCFLDNGTYFEFENCRNPKLPGLMVHHLTEILVVLLHVFVNFNRLSIMLHPQDLELTKKSTFIYLILFIFSLFIAITYVLFNQDIVTQKIAFLFILSSNFLDLFLEIKLKKLSKKVFQETRGTINLLGRFEIYTSQKIIKSFISASISGISLKFIALTLAFLQNADFLGIEKEHYFLLINLLWNIDATFFPWCFLVEDQGVLKILGFAKKESTSVVNLVENQNDYFNNLKIAWA
ncbi:unnamed protein product [Caenorhabditis angaria]|uniref:7TM GPCR serpentine receptor class x (Srx) domain-containing protein n=1 Tax=Caenorhabditis angaria TaxID=860376 RepID=A0A9P1IDJ6_9PELO|nr:unnamed protein product [Caenorhabditis angaria]